MAWGMVWGMVQERVPGTVLGTVQEIVLGMFWGHINCNFHLGDEEVLSP